MSGEHENCLHMWSSKMQPLPVKRTRIPDTCPVRENRIVQTWVLKLKCVSWEHKPMKPERSERDGTARNATPSGAGGGPDDDCGNEGSCGEDEEEEVR